MIHIDRNPIFFFFQINLYHIPIGTPIIKPLCIALVAHTCHSIVSIYFNPYNCVVSKHNFLFLPLYNVKFYIGGIKSNKGKFYIISKRIFTYRIKKKISRRLRFHKFLTVIPKSIKLLRISLYSNYPSAPPFHIHLYYNLCIVCWCFCFHMFVYKFYIYCYILQL